MGKDNKLDVSVLREVTNRIFDFIEHTQDQNEVDFSNNYYWNIADEELYNLKNSPKDLDNGSLLDDWHFVAKAHEESSQAIPITLIHVAPLLRYLSHVISSCPPISSDGSDT